MFLICFAFLCIAIWFWYQSIQQDDTQASIETGIQMLKTHSLKIYIWETLSPFHGTYMYWNFAQDKEQSFLIMVEAMHENDLKGYYQVCFKSYYIEQVIGSSDKLKNEEIVLKIIDSLQAAWDNAPYINMEEL
ncbi:MAG: hypothetical protein JXR91_09010 [Deltaproteobacteria bacterium]|nr:hypothetical protein [Deltaproteobacteria bacterium]